MLRESLKDSSNSMNKKYSTTKLQVGSHLHNHAKTQTQSILQQLQKVIEASRMLQKAKEGVKVAIVGRPNVGKSTLINGLVKREVAIVSEIPGTTRDLIEVNSKLIKSSF